MLFFGHTTTHKPQPLHRSVSIIILPAIFIFRIYSKSRLLDCNADKRFCKVKRQLAAYKIIEASETLLFAIEIDRQNPKITVVLQGHVAFCSDDFWSIGF